MRMTRTKRSWTHRLALVLGALVALSSLHGQAIAEDPIPIRSKPDRKGIVRLGVLTDIKGLDPARAEDDPSRLIILNAYDQLFRYHHLKRPFVLEPCLARAMPEVSEDRLVWTIRLRENVRFADDPCFPGGKGRVCTASDVVFAFRRTLDASGPTPGSWLFEHHVKGAKAFLQASKALKPDPKRTKFEGLGVPRIEGFEVVDVTTLRIHLTRPYPALPYVLASSYGSIYPPEAIRHYGAEFAKHIVTTGPYVMDGAFAKTQVHLKRNPSYREDLYPTDGIEEDTPRDFLEDAGQRLPLNERVFVSKYKDENIAWAAFEAGELDQARVPRSEAFYYIVEPVTFALRPAWAARGVRLHRESELEVHYTAFNMENPVYGHPAGERGKAIRRAICLARDDTWSIQRMHLGMVEPIQGPLIREFEEYDPWFSNSWKRQEGETLDDALELARETLAEAGMANGEGVPVLRMQVLDFPWMREPFAALKKRMASIGLRFKAEYIAWPELRKRIKAKTADMWDISWRLDYPDAENLLQLFYGPYGPSPNDSNYSNPKFDELYERALLLPAGDDRTILYREMQDIVAEDCVYRWRYRPQHLSVVQPWLHNWRLNGIAPRQFAYLRAHTLDRRGILMRWAKQKAEGNAPQKPPAKDAADKPTDDAGGGE